MRNFVIYLSETNPVGILWDKLNPNFSKSVNIVFDRKTISENYSDIKDQFKQILSDISNETSANERAIRLRLQKSLSRARSYVSTEWSYDTVLRKRQEFQSAS